MREAGKRRLDGDAGGADEDLAVVREPASGGEPHFARFGTLLHLWRDYEEVAHGKLILDRRVAVSGKRILHRPQHRLSAFSAFAGKGEDARREPLAKIHRRPDERKMLFVEDAPRSDGELHHRRERVNLRRADEQLLVYRNAGPEAAEQPAADHVGADEEVSEKPSRRHVGDELLQVAPCTLFTLAQSILKDRGGE